MKNSGIKFETLRKSYVKPIVIGVVVFVVVMSVLVLRGTMAKYQYKKSVKLAEGVINYKMPDFNLIALNIQDESGEYVTASSVPSEGYTLNEEMSYCAKTESDGTKTTLSDVMIEYVNGSLTFSNVVENGTKCYVYFDVINGQTMQEIIASKTVSTRSDFSTVLTEDTTGTIYSAEDDDGTTYYFAGAPTDNYVKFAGYYWRIIRVNGDGSIRLIYNGTSTTTTGTGTQISTSAFNTSYNDNAYVGFMYGTTSASTYAATHTNTNDSTIKEVLDTWYSNNLASYASYIDTNAGFCGDRTSNTSSSGAPTTGTSGGYGTTMTYYGAGYRLNTNKAPSFKCQISTDLYTVSSSSKGNKALTNPIGLITADEVAYVGGVYQTNDTSYYLYTGQYYWTMSPSGFYGSYACVFLVSPSGFLGDYWVNSEFGVRPVINLKANTQFTGSGLASDPFAVV